MLFLPIRKAVGLIWISFIISITLAVLALLVSIRVDTEGPARVVFPVIVAGSIMMAYFSFRSLQAIKRGLLETAEQLRQRFDRRGEALHATEKMAALGRLAAGVAHEIRNPLTSIKMRLFSLGREFEEGSPQKEDADVIKEEVEQLESIVHNFLQYARPAELKLEPSSINEILASVLELLQHRFRSQEITVRSPQGNGVMVLADRQQLRQVFMNILLNACDAMPDGGDIGITFEPGGEGDAKTVKVRIGNTGAPISPDDAGHIFDPFFSTRDDGTGLGLSIARQIVESHGGEIKLDSPAPGESVCFSVTLPAAS